MVSKGLRVRVNVIEGIRLGKRDLEKISKWLIGSNRLGNTVIEGYVQ
jgi:hypothetical protein